MKIALFYYSATGNTKKVCEYIQKKIPQLILINIATTVEQKSEDYEIIGIAFPVFYLSIPPNVASFLNSFTIQKNKPVFILATYGMMQGKSITNTAKILNKKGFNIFDSFALQMPESYPPFLVKGWTDIEAPNQEEMVKLNSFIETINNIIVALKIGNTPERKIIQNGIINSLIPIPSDKKKRKDFGELILDEQVCTSCGICEESCVYNAISIKKVPTFNMEKCAFCYACYNKCAKNAIKTTRLSSKAQYHFPDIKLKEKFL